MASKSKKKPNGKDVLLILLALIALCAVLVAIWALSTRNREKPAEGAEANAEPVEKLTETIALPQFPFLNLIADTREQTLTFDNPSQNFAAFRVSIALDGETLWESEALSPGETSASVILSRALAPGEYQANLIYTCFTDDDAQSPLNGANSPIILKVK